MSENRRGFRSYLYARFTELLASSLPAALVCVKRLVRHLVHRLPIHARPPRGDADAERDGHRHLLGAIELLERLPDADAHLARLVLVGFWHRHPEPVRAQPPASVSRPHGALQLLGEDPD